MPHHRETRLVPYSAEQMFTLVADVRRYPEFLPWVVAMRVREEREESITADMIVGFKGLRESFTSKVHKEPHSLILVDYVDGPLSNLHNQWLFKPADDGCAIDFTVDFTFRSRVFEALAGQMFDRALRKMIGAFEARADALYGISNSSA